MPDARGAREEDGDCALRDYVQGVSLRLNNSQLKGVLKTVARRHRGEAQRSYPRLPRHLVEAGSPGRWAGHGQGG